MHGYLQEHGMHGWQAVWARKAVHWNKNQVRTVQEIGCRKLKACLAHVCVGGLPVCWHCHARGKTWGYAGA